MLSVGYRKIKTASQKWLLNSCVSACEVSRIAAGLINLWGFFNLKVN